MTASAGVQIPTTSTFAAMTCSALRPPASARARIVATGQDRLDEAALRIGAADEHPVAGDRDGLEGVGASTGDELVRAVVDVPRAAALQDDARGANGRIVSSSKGLGVRGTPAEVEQGWDREQRELLGTDRRRRAVAAGDAGVRR